MTISALSVRVLNVLLRELQCVLAVALTAQPGIIVLPQHETTC